MSLRIMLLVLLAVSLPRVVAQEKRASSAVLDLLETRVFKEQRTRGLAVGVIDSTGSQLYLLGLQEERGAEVGLDTVFEIGSISKVMTGIVLSALERRQTLALDDSIEIGLPKSIDTESLKPTLPTLRDLASHRSGLPRLPFNLKAFSKDPYADYGVVELWKGLERVKLTKNRPQKFRYSNFGVGLLGTLLERRSGKDLETLCRTHIWEPLGMTSTSFQDPAAEVFACGHNVDLEEQAHWHFQALAGAGGVRSTLPDMMKFLRANMGVSELKPESRAILEQAMTVPLGQGHVGLCWHLDRRTKGTIVWHNGGTGGFASFLGFDRALGRGVVILSNSNADVTELGFHLLNPSLPLTKFPQIQTNAVERARREELVGKYSLRKGFVMEVRLDGTGLSLQATGQPRFRLYPVSAERWAVKAVPAVVEFRRAEDGSVSGMILHQGGSSQLAPRQTP